MPEEPTAPEADDIAEDLDDEPEVEGFMDLPKLGAFGSIMPPVKAPPSGPAGPGPSGDGGTIGGGSGGTGPSTVNFPRPS